MDFTDGNTMSIKGNDSHFLSVDLEKLTAHQFIVVIVRDGKDCLGITSFRVYWEIMMDSFLSIMGK